MRYVIILLVLFVLPVQAQDKLTVATWNIRNISDNSRSDAELGIISLIIFRYDFIALQEVLDEAVITRIESILKNDFQADYDIEVSDQVGNNKKERYAFIWRTDKVTKVSDGVSYNDVGNKFEREPFCGHFKAGNFDFKPCTIHLLFGDNKAHRRPELKLLDDVYRATKAESSEDDILIMGDFNFDPDDSGWSELKAEDNMKHAIDPPLKTTIADVSLYDNIWWPDSSHEVIETSGEVFEWDELMYPPGSRKEANRLTSDHRPVSISVNLPSSDDD
jgi:endonuclease/exonuclease/phosphatase family metal-dependent hydrolase